MALKWYELDDIVLSEAKHTQGRAESTLSWLQSQEEARRREREKVAAARGERTAAQWLATGRAKQCAQASQELFDTNKKLQKLGFSTIPISQSNVKRQISSGHGWANQLVQQLQNEKYLEEHEQEAKLRADIIGKLLKDEHITYETPPDVVDTMYQQKRAEYYKDQAFKRGDYENTTYWRNVAEQLSLGFVAQPSQPSPERQQVWIPPTETGEQLPSVQKPQPEVTPVAGKGTPEMALPSFGAAEQPTKELVSAEQARFVELFSVTGQGDRIRFPRTAVVSGKVTQVDTLFPGLEDYYGEMGREVVPAKIEGQMLGRGLQLLPQQLGATILQAIQGQGGASVVNPDWADRWIAQANENVDAFAEEIRETYDSPYLLELAYLSRNLAYSITSMGAGLATGVPIAFLPVPGARVAAWGAGTAASGAVAYQMTTYQIMQEYLEIRNEEKIQQVGRGLTLEEENWLKQDFHSKAVKYGLWEAVPEAISNLLFAQILVGPLGRMVGGPAAARIVAKVAGMYGQELLTETITQGGQSAIEVEAGLRDKKLTFIEAFKEVAPQTFLLTTVMAGAGQTIIGTTAAIKKAKASLKSEIGEEHPLYDEINNGLEEHVTELAKEIPAEGIQVPEKGKAVKPTAVAEEVTAKPRAKTIEAARNEIQRELEYAQGRVEELRGELRQRGGTRANRAWRNNELARNNMLVAEYGRLLRENNPEELLRYAPETTALTEDETITGEVTEGEVTVEGLEPVRELKKISNRFRERRVAHDTTKKQLVDYAKKHLPLPVRGKLLTAVKNAKTETDLTKAIALGERYAEQYTQTTLSKKITTELQAKKLAARKEYGRFTVETQRKLNTVKRNLVLDRENAKDEILRNIEAADEGKISYEDAEDANEILMVSGIKGMSSQELAYTLAYIKSLKETGRGLRAAEREAAKERDDALRGEIIDKLTQGEGIKAGVGTVDTRDLEVTRKDWKAKAKSFVTNWQYGIDDVLDVLSKYDKTSKPFQSIISQIGIGLHMARSKQMAGVQHYTQRVASKVREIYEFKSNRELGQFLSHFSKEKISLGTFVTTEGKTVTLSLTKDQIVEKYLQLQDPTLDETFRIGMKWTDQMMSAVKDSMTAEDIKLAEWLLDFYQEYGQTIKPHFEAKYHIPWPDNPFYSPLNRDLEASFYEHILAVKDNFRYLGVTNNNLKARKKNQVPLRFNGATQVLVNHIIHMEHFKAFSTPMKQARVVFQNKDVRTAIRQYHGQDILGHLDRHLDQIARDGLDKARIHHWVDTLRRHFTLAALGLKPIVSLKQAGSLPAYLTYEEMPVGDFFEGVADFWKAPIAHFKEMRDASGYFTDRWGRGHERDIRHAVEKGLTARLSNPKNWRDLLMLGIRGVDTLTTSAGSWAVYRSMQKQKLSKEQAILHAEIATKRSQPSFGLEDMAALRKHGSFAALATMFQSQPNKYYRLIANSARNLKHGRGSKSRQVLNILIAWWLLPAFFQFASDAFQWKKEHQLRVGLLGPANYLLAGGQLIQSLWGWVTKEPFTHEVSPVLDSINEIQWALQRTVKMIEQGKDPLEEVDSEYLVKTIEHYAQAIGQLAGVPTPYAIQVERAIRNADPRQLVFSQYALRPPKGVEDVVGDLQELYAREVCGKDRWKDLTREQQDRFWLLRPDLK